MRPSSFRNWIIALLLALPSIFWPLTEKVFPPNSFSVFLPHLNQIDVAYPLCWMDRIATDPQVTDLTLWEHRHDGGSPSSLVTLWPKIMGGFVHLWGGLTAYWGLVYLCHAIWIFITYRWISHFLRNQSMAWWIASLFVYGSFLLGINIFQQGRRIENWSIMCAYENFRAYPSVVSLLISTLAIWRFYEAYKNSSIKNFALAGLCTAMTPYGRPFDWMILTTFMGLMGIRSYFKDPSYAWQKWGLALLTNLIGTLPFLIRYVIWMKGDTSIYEDGLSRGVLQGKEGIHFIKYGLMASGSCFFTWIWIRSLHSKSKGEWKQQDIDFFIILIISSFLPYFQHALNGKTISSYQYYFIYFSFPFLWLTFLLGLALRMEFWIPQKIKFIWPLLGFLIGAAIQASLALTPTWMMDRIKFKNEYQTLYDEIKKYPETAVVLSSNALNGGSQELILRSGAWSFVPHPMMFTYASMAETTELLERQLLAKLLLTGTVSDLAPIFSAQGFPGYEKFYAEANPETALWIDRLENCPARSFFFFHPIKSRKDFQIRKMQIPPPLLQQSESFAYFEPKYQAVFTRVQSLEKLTFDEIMDHVLHQFRLTHILIKPANPAWKNRLQHYSHRFKLLMESPDGSSLWLVVETPRKK